MSIEIPLNVILNTSTKLKILRLFFSHTADFRIPGREIGRRVNISPPAVHAALKDLFNQDVLKMEIIGKQHIYSLNSKNRIVKDILAPSFKKELSLQEDIKHFLLKKIKESGIKGKIGSLILYGSMQRAEATNKSDVDIAVIVKETDNVKEIEDKIVGEIARQFKEYFGLNLDAYVKSEAEFINRIEKKLPPVSSLIKSYSVFFGKDPKELKKL
jgi:predicted nucleotidyltransferase